MSEEEEGKNVQKIENQHIDQAHDLSDNSEDIQSGDDENAEPATGKGRKVDYSGGDSRDQLDKDVKIAGAYNPSDYDKLDVSSEIKELFKYITRHKAPTLEIQPKLRPFVPDYIPTIGEVDAFLKMPRPDDQEETLGLQILDEPSLNQSKRALLDMQIKQFIQQKGVGEVTVHSIENPEQNPKQISSWINDVSELHKQKQPPSVSYTKSMPEFDQLMEVWPQEFQEALAGLSLQGKSIPNEQIDLSVEDYSKFACTLLDIPIHNTTNNQNIIESLHVLFTLYSQFQANQHFQQNQQENNGY